MAKGNEIGIRAVGDGRSAYKDQPVTFGVPLEEGRLRLDDLPNVSLSDTEGNAYPLQVSCPRAGRA
jgi:hypothetical protein